MDRRFWNFNTQGVPKSKRGVSYGYSQDVWRNLLPGLQGFNFGFSCFTLILFLVVRVPVRYKKLIEDGNATREAIINTMLEPLTVYYFIYALLAFISLRVNRWYGTFLLLDICVKDTTTGDVLLAVWTPKKQLFMTLILGIFVIYIFAMLIFLYFAGDFDGGSAGTAGVNDCKTLWSCIKVS